MKKITRATLIQAFKTLFNAEPMVVRAPGRINIIGEHTDYNDGFVVPAAIDKAIYACISERDDDKVHLFSERYRQWDCSDLSNIKRSENAWANYILGVVSQLQQQFFGIRGFNLYVDGDVPLGAGLSSSAAVECATAFALDQLFKLNIPKMELAFISQRAEQLFTGVNCGIMDQFASVFGKRDMAMLLDCRSMQYDYLPLQMSGYRLLLLNTNVKHSLADSSYNKRRAKCEQGVAWINAHNKEVKSLRDADVKMLADFVAPVDIDTYHKCLYVIEENTRVQKAVQALTCGNLAALGKLMFETHHGLSKFYQVSCKELDYLVGIAQGTAGVLGARMMGGGFGGCTINLVKDEQVEVFIERASIGYRERFGISLDAQLVATDFGVGIMD